MSKYFNAAVLTSRKPVARKHLDIVCPDFDGELIFRVVEPEGDALVRAAAKHAEGGDLGGTISLIADCVVDGETGRPVFADYKSAANFFMQNSSTLSELIEAIGELASTDFDEEEEKDPTSAV